MTGWNRGEKWGCKVGEGERGAGRGREASMGKPTDTDSFHKKNHMGPKTKK